ncbi:MAG: hypothetical protein ACP5M4_09065 [Acidobacteriaceae bacterium]
MPASLGDVVGLPVPGMRHHADLRNMVEQLLPGRPWIARQQCAEVSHPFRDEVADVRQMSFDRIVTLSQ